jgi:hypothetical protein
MAIFDRFMTASVEMIRPRNDHPEAETRSLPLESPLRMADRRIPMAALSPLAKGGDPL